MNTPPLARRLLAELLGSAFLAALVIGSGIAAQTLSPNDVGLELFENAAATAAGLYTIILMFGPVSGGHFNPVVSLADASFGGIRWRDALAYMPAQVAGCVLGAVVANGMFSLAAISISTHHRASPAHLFSEVIATAGLLLVIFSLARTQTREHHPRRRRRVHRRRLLLHQLGQLRQPGDQRRAHVLQHVRRHRARLGARLHRRAARRRCLRDPRHPGALPRRDTGRGSRRHHATPRAGSRVTAPELAAMATVLFVCLHNAGRSQMSQALFERAAAGRHTALSAGTTPAEHVHPEVIEVMRELGIDLSDRSPNCSRRELAEQADVVVTMGCGDACPYIPGKRYIDWDLPDPKGRPIAEVSATRDDIARRVDSLLADETLK